MVAPGMQTVHVDLILFERKKSENDSLAICGDLKDSLRLSSHKDKIEQKLSR